MICSYNRQGSVSVLASHVFISESLSAFFLTKEIIQVFMVINGSLLQ